MFMVEEEKDAARRRYLRGLGDRGRSLTRRTREEWAGEPAAIYCRISHVADDDQTGVDRQERICREVADRLGVKVAPEHVFVDNNRSAWHRSRRRKGWDAMLALAKDRKVRHVIAYHPDRLMRQPKDLEALLDIADEWDITLHGQANRRDLSSPDDRFFLRLEVAHACRSSDDTSRRMTEAMVDRAFDLKPHAGPRRFGYTSTGLDIVREEADFVRWIFGAFVDGMTAHAIAAALNQWGVPTVQGKAWQAHTILSLLDSRHHAGILSFRGEDICGPGEGAWPALIDPHTWADVRQARETRASRWRAAMPTENRFYLLRGLMLCSRCGTRMVGGGGAKARYYCARTQRRDDEQCSRSILAEATERFIVDAAVILLENLDMTASADSVLDLSQAAQDTITAAETRIGELKDMWKAREITTSEYRADRKTEEDTIRRARKSTSRRPTLTILEGMVGPNARASWTALETEREFERMNAILRFLFTAVIIEGTTSKAPTFDYGRIMIDPRPL